MEITPNFNCVEGGFNTQDAVMICVSKQKYGQVHLCVKSENGWNVPIAEIKLYSKPTFGEAMGVFDDATKLCEEIARRWNECETKK